MFFDALKKEAFAITNQDDKNGLVMFQNCKAHQYTYSIKSIGDFTARLIENQFSGLNLNVDGQDVWFRLTGSFNAYNLLAIYSAAMLLGQDQQEVLSAMSNLSSAHGRFEVLQDHRGISAIVDYAHTPDALLNVLQTIHDVLAEGSRIICVVGAGGNRDKTKRPKMARIAADYSHQVILTSDNPRFEKPEDILADMKAGLSASKSLKTISITNREEAIKTAYQLANPGDVILVAGKGHESYQEIEGVKHHFDDKEVINKLFNQN
jgi:UDP-N-acetylmuramoyl-L-alanyl-D-glutamate--2,6-diaminopimelate ligase